MRRIFRACLIASSLTGLSVAPFFDLPVQAQIGVDISFDTFHDQLSNYGDWLYSDRWGEVWRPMQQDQDPNWRPYTVGHWVFTDEYGWTWASDESGWGDVVYHYGRWVYDPDAGWLWMAGYVWSPAWVVWRSAGPNVGWMPMPPDQSFLGFGNPGTGLDVSFGDWDNINGYYGYSDWYGPRFNDALFGAMWTFVPMAHVADPGYRNYAVATPRIVNIVRNSRNVTNYTVINNVIINKSMNVTVVQQASGHPIAPVHAAAALHNSRWIAPVNKGVQVQAQMRQATPRGNGATNSAPRPTPAQVQTLSTRAVPLKGASSGAAPTHIFTRTTVAQTNTRPNGNPNLTAPAQQGRPNSALPQPAANTPARPNTSPGRPNPTPRTASRPTEAAAPAPELQRETQPKPITAPNPLLPPSQQRIERPSTANAPTPQPAPQDRREAQPQQQRLFEPGRPAPPSPRPQERRDAQPLQPPRPETARPPEPPRPPTAAKPIPPAKPEPKKPDDKRPDQ